jgi:hypothetical protein
MREVLVNLMLRQLKHGTVAAAAAGEVVHGQQQRGVDACTLCLCNTVKLNLHVQKSQQGGGKQMPC